MIRRPRNEHSRPSMNHDNNGAGMQTRSVSVSSSSSLSIAQEAHATRKNRCFSPTQAISSNHGGFMLLEVSKILSCAASRAGYLRTYYKKYSTSEAAAAAALWPGQARPAPGSIVIRPGSKWQCGRLAVCQTTLPQARSLSQCPSVPVSQCPSGPHSSPRD